VTEKELTSTGIVVTLLKQRWRSRHDLIMAALEEGADLKTIEGTLFNLVDRDLLQQLFAAPSEMTRGTTPAG